MNGEGRIELLFTRCVCVCATVCERASMSGAESWKFIATPSSWLGSLNVFCSVHCVMEFFCVSWDCFHALQTRRTHTLVSDNNNHPTSTYPLSSAYHLFCLRFGEQTNHSFCGAIKTSNDFDLFSVIDSRHTSTACALNVVSFVYQFCSTPFWSQTMPKLLKIYHAKFYFGYSHF